MADDGSKELTLTKVFDAPRALVWRAWTDPELVSKWWGPRGVTNPECEVDARVGGKLYIVMLAGKELGPLAMQRWPMRGMFREVDEPNKLVFTNQALDEKGYVLIDGVTTVTFEEQNGKTRVVMHTVARAMIPKAEQMIAGMTDGWTQSLEKLAEVVGQ